MDYTGEKHWPLLRTLSLNGHACGASLLTEHMQPAAGQMLSWRGVHNSSSSHQELRTPGLGPSISYQGVLNSMAAMSPPELTQGSVGLCPGPAKGILHGPDTVGFEPHRSCRALESFSALSGSWGCFGHWVTKQSRVCLAGVWSLLSSTAALLQGLCDPGQVAWLFFASSFPCMKGTAALPCTARGCEGSCLPSRMVSMADGC